MWRTYSVIQLTIIQIVNRLAKQKYHPIQNSREKKTLLYTATSCTCSQWFTQVVYNQITLCFISRKIKYIELIKCLVSCWRFCEKEYSSLKADRTSNTHILVISVSPKCLYKMWQISKKKKVDIISDSN